MIFCAANPFNKITNIKMFIFFCVKVFPMPFELILFNSDLCDLLNTLKCYDRLRNSQLITSFIPNGLEKNGTSFDYKKKNNFVLMKEIDVACVSDIKKKTIMGLRRLNYFDFIQMGELHHTNQLDLLLVTSVINSSFKIKIF